MKILTHAPADQHVSIPILSGVCQAVKYIAVSLAWLIRCQILQRNSVVLFLGSSGQDYFHPSFHPTCCCTRKCSQHPQRLQQAPAL